jgi:hypothetical protein
VARNTPEWVEDFTYWYENISFIGKVFFWWVIILCTGIIVTGIVFVVLGSWIGWVILGVSAVVLTIAGGFYVEENGW